MVARSRVRQKQITPTQLLQHSITNDNLAPNSHIIRATLSLRCFTNAEMQSQREYPPGPPRSAASDLRGLQRARRPRTRQKQIHIPAPAGGMHVASRSARQ